MCLRSQRNELEEGGWRTGLDVEFGTSDLRNLVQLYKNPQFPKLQKEIKAFIIEQLCFRYMNIYID